MRALAKQSSSTLERSSSLDCFTSFAKTTECLLYSFQCDCHDDIATSQQALHASNAQLKQILVDAKPMHEGIGGKMRLDEAPVFFKKVLLTDFEQLLQNFMSTANLFNLPVAIMQYKHADVSLKKLEMNPLNITFIIVHNVL